MILQAVRPYADRATPAAALLELAVIDTATARWVAKGARQRRAAQALGVLFVVQPDPPDGIRGRAVFGTHAFHRFPRDAFWRLGPWDRRQQPYVSTGRTFPGEITAQCEFVPVDSRWGPAALAREEDLIALDTLLSIWCRGAPPDGVYDLERFR